MSFSQQELQKYLDLHNLPEIFKESLASVLRYRPKEPISYLKYCFSELEIVLRDVAVPVCSKAGVYYFLTVCRNFSVPAK